jgi:hypothetical protein
MTGAGHFPGLRWPLVHHSRMHPAPAAYVHSTRRWFSLGPPLAHAPEASWCWMGTQMGLKATQCGSWFYVLGRRCSTRQSQNNNEG